MSEHRPRRDGDPSDERPAPEPPGEASAPAGRRPEPAAEEMGGESACQMHRFFDLDAEE